jgi:hypothetical protein
MKKYGIREQRKGILKGHASERRNSNGQKTHEKMLTISSKLKPH